MHTLEKIEYAQNRILELEILIKYWKAKLEETEHIININKIKDKKNEKPVIAA